MRPEFCLCMVVCFHKTLAWSRTLLRAHLALINNIIAKPVTHKHRLMAAEMHRLWSFEWSPRCVGWRVTARVIQEGAPEESNVRALIIRIGFWGVPYYNCSIIYPKPYSNY